MSEKSSQPDERPARTRLRSSARRKELIAVAANLFASRGYYAVTVDDIGDAVGLTGPALYRHFSSKEALLVAVFDQVIDQLTNRFRELVSEAPDPATALLAIVRLHVEFAIEQRENVAVWRQEFQNLPEPDRWRLRRAQRLYVEEWVHLVHELRPEFSDTEVRTAVHAAMGLLQSPSDFQSGLAAEAAVNLLMSMALAALAHASTQPLELTMYSS
ncbi:MAG TPA: TetR/AcrR family transcriptional regulator [Acidimicrobiia bacterium]|nr:TetR/AcrR family transcriptional regulator [Acidimicrobiia bacterium]HMC36297.1 TetR/AcrR family transcriptional regulator [Actinomycetota bacterium]